MCALWSLSFLNAQPQSVFLPVTKATIHENGTTVTRADTIQLQKGSNSIIVDGLPLDFDASTLNISISNDVLIQSQKVIREYGRTIKVNKDHLHEAILELNDSLDLYNSYIEILFGEEDIMKKNNDFSNLESGFTGEDVAALRSVFATEMKRIKEDQLLYKRKIRKLKNEIKSISRQIKEEGKIEKKGFAQIEMDLESDTSGLTDITVAYFDQSAGWTPAYDLRVDGLNNPLNIVYKAQIFQNTGEDWENVTLSLSTAIPDHDYTLPDFDPYFLTFNNYYSNESNQLSKSPSGIITGKIVDDSGEPLIGATVLLKGTTKGTITDVDGQYHIRVPRGQNTLVLSYVGYQSIEVPITNRVMSHTLHYAESLEEVVVTGSASSVSVRGMASGVALRQTPRTMTLSIVKTQTALNYDISNPVSINSTSREKTILIRSELVEVDYEYLLYPKFEKFAFLTAEIDNWQQLPSYSWYS